jgi:hypothetical protein
VGSVQWGLDGNLVNSLGTPAAGSHTFTVPNIEGLAHGPHVLEIVGTNGSDRYADATQIDTSQLPDQQFSDAWQIVYLFPSPSHSSVTANGRVGLSQIAWGVPGQQYDRHLSSTSVVLTSLLPADGPQESRTTAAPRLVVKGIEHVMQEIPGIGPDNFWSAAFGLCTAGVPLATCTAGQPLPLDVFLNSGSPAQFKLTGFTSTFDKIWISSPWMFATFPQIFYGILNFTIN